MKPPNSPRLWRVIPRSWVPYWIGTFLGLLAWHWTRFPFRNPDQVQGYMALIHYSQLNDTLGFLVLWTLPLALLWLSRRSLPIGSSPNPPASAANSWKSITILAVFTSLAATNLPTYHASGPLDTFHEGETLGSAASWNWNQVAYRDEGFIHGIVEDPLQGVLAFRLFGRSIGAVRSLKSILKVLVWVLAAMALYRLFRNDFDRALGCLSLWVLLHQGALFFLFASPLLDLSRCIPVLSSLNPAFRAVHSWGWVLVTGRDLTTFAFILASLPQFRHPIGSPRSWLVSLALIGFIPWAAFVDTVDRGVFLLVASLILALLSWAAWRGTDRGRYTLWAYGAGLLAGTLFLGAFLRWDYPPFLEYVFVQIPQWRDLWSGLPYRIEEPRYLILACLITALGYTLLTKVLAAKSLRDPKNLRAFLTTWGPAGLMTLLTALFFRDALGRSDGEHLSYVGWLAVTAALLLTSRPLRPRARTSIRVVAGILAFACLYGWFRLPLFTLNFPSDIPDESFLSSSEAATRDYLVHQGAQKDGFFSFTSEGIWYYLIDRPCPTRFPSTFALFGKPLQKETVLSLEVKKPKWLLYRNGRWSGAIDGIPNEVRMPVLAAYLRDHYAPVTVIGDQEIWKRLPGERKTDSTRPWAVNPETGDPKGSSH